MAKPYENRSNRALRNLGSAGSELVKFTGDTTGKAVIGLFKWAATDHSGINDAFSQMPKMGLFEGLRYTLMLALIRIVGTIVVGVLMFLLILLLVQI